MEFSMKTLLVIVLLLIAFVIVLTLYISWGGKSNSLIDILFGWIKDVGPK